ncbi:MAG: transcriptional repressor [Bdellovibrionaceae bacterium]|nr:transcriptional repressor [Pseudobdellovibrionaceae bacterium]
MKKGSKELLLQKMKDNKMKLTRQREEILECLLSTHQPQTAESILAKLKKSKVAGACDLVTIYRTLHQFEKIRLVQKSFFADNSAQYCLNDLEDDEHHHHFLCKKCHKITAIDLCVIENQTKLLERKGFKEISHRLEFFGLCPQCA